MGELLKWLDPDYRAEFYRRQQCYEGTTYAQILQRADAVKAQRAAAEDARWWRNPAIWQGDDKFHSVTEATAILNIALRSAGHTPEAELRVIRRPDPNAPEDRHKKQCAACRRLLHKTEFSLHARTSDGLQSYCKSCHKAAAAAWRKRCKYARDGFYQAA